MTQVADVVMFIVRFGSITNKQAMKIGVGRLSARIKDLRDVGIGIDTIPVIIPKPNGKASRIGKYVFHSEESKRLALERFVNAA